MKYSILSMLSVAFLLSACTESQEELLPVNPLPSASEDQVIDDQASPAQATEINQALLSGLWEVVLLVDEGVDETNEVANFQFDFADGGVVTASTTTEPIESFEGNYTVLFDDNQTELSMSFPMAGPLDDLNDDWYFVEGSNVLLVFEDNSDNPPSALTLQQVGTDEGDNNNEGDNNGDELTEQLENIQSELVNYTWVVALLVDDDEDETAELANYAFAFGGDGTLTATQSDNPDFLEIGTYTLFIDDNRIELAIEFNANEALQNLTDDWYYISSTEETIVFEDDQSELLNALTLQKQ